MFEASALIYNLQHAIDGGCNILSISIPLLDILSPITARREPSSGRGHECWPDLVS